LSVDATRGAELEATQCHRRRVGEPGRCVESSPARGRGHSARILTPALSSSFSSPTIRSISASAPATTRSVRSANRNRPSCSRSCATGRAGGGLSRHGAVWLDQPRRSRGGRLDHPERVPAMSAANPFTHRIVGRSRQDYVDIYTCKARGCVSHDRARSSRVPPVRRLVGCQNDCPLSRLTCPSCGATWERSSGGSPT
jgi:hypothetical protein